MYQSTNNEIIKHANATNKSSSFSPIDRFSRRCGDRRQPFSGLPIVNIAWRIRYFGGRERELWWPVSGGRRRAKVTENCGGEWSSKRRGKTNPWTQEERTLSLYRLCESDRPRRRERERERERENGAETAERSNGSFGIA